MAAACQLNRPQNSQFQLDNPQLSLQNSVEFIKKITLIAVSSVISQRKLFPSSAFIDRKCAGKEVKVMKINESIPGTKKVCSWVKSAIATIHAKKLKKLVLVILKETDDGSTEPIEMYKFNYSYENQDVVCDIITDSQQLRQLNQNANNEVPQDIKESSLNLISSVMSLTADLKPLPDDFYLRMWLQIADDGTEYNLSKEFFETDSVDIIFPSEARNLKVGKLQTNYGSFSVSAKTVETDDTQEIMETPQKRKRNTEEEEDVSPVHDNKR